MLQGPSGRLFTIKKWRVALHLAVAVLHFTSRLLQTEDAINLMSMQLATVFSPAGSACEDPPYAVNEVAAETQQLQHAAPYTPRTNVSSSIRQGTAGSALPLRSRASSAASSASGVALPYSLHKPPASPMHMDALVRAVRADSEARIAQLRAELEVVRSGKLQAAAELSDCAAAARQDKRDAAKAVADLQNAVQQAKQETKAAEQARAQAAATAAAEAAAADAEFMELEQTLAM
jgi:hypothetical protein